MRSKIFTGRTQECLADFGRRFPESADILSMFAEVVPDTIYRWTKRGTPPVGPTLVKARIFLDAVGYSVKELDDLPEKNRLLAKLIGYGLIEADAVKQLLDYTNVNAVLGIALRGAGVTPARDTKLNQLFTDYQDKLAIAEASFEAYLERELGHEDKRRMPWTPPTESTSPRREMWDDVAEAALQEAHTRHLVAALANALRCVDSLLVALGDDVSLLWKNMDREEFEKLFPRLALLGQSDA